MTRGLVAGVDSSTQSTKVELRDIDSGDLVARSTAPHPPTTPPLSEQDPEAWWSALLDCFSQLGELRNEISALNVAGQQHGLVLLDESGSALRPAKLWNDSTSAPQAARLVAEFGAADWAAGCGSVPVASFTISKLAWVFDHEPHVIARTAKVMLPHDYLTWRMTDQHVTDRGDASGTGWFDPATNTYVTELLGTVLDDPEQWLTKLPRVLGPRDPAGEITSDAATALGIGRDVVVGPGTGDNMAAALGIGLRPGDVVMSLGTSGTVSSVSRTATADVTGTIAGFADASGQFLPLVCTLNATRVTDTVAGWLGTDNQGLATLALAAQDRDDGPVLIPYFDGERTPNLPDATGSFVGLRNDTSREDLARAAYDGVACGLLAGIDALADAGVEVAGRLTLTGGGARSAAYRRRIATITGRTVRVPHNDEAAAAGAAVQAAAIQTGRSLDEIAVSWRLASGTDQDPDESSNGAAIQDRYREAAQAGR